MLLLLAQHTRPDIANATRELSKANDGVNTAALEEFLLVINYVLDMKNFGLKDIAKYLIGSHKHLSISHDDTVLM